MLNKIIGGLAGLLFLVGGATAQTCSSYTYTLSNGTTADADQVMSNFNTVRNCVNTLASGGTLTNPTLTTPNIGAATATSINFGGSTLSAYIEGTWTPSLGGTATYAVQVGRYTRIGRQVTAFFRLNVSTLGTGSATTISGLPTADDGTMPYGGQVYTWSGLNVTPVFLGARVASQTIVFDGATAANATLSTAMSIFKDGAFIYGVVTYFQ